MWGAWYGSLGFSWNPFSHKKRNNMNMDKKEYVDSVMRVLGNSSIELYTYEYDVFQSELESEYDKVLESENDRVLDKTYLSQRMLMHLQAG